MTQISAERARDYLNILSSSAMRYSASSEYRRGAVEMADKMAVYLDALVDEPEADRPVREEAA